MTLTSAAQMRSLRGFRVALGVAALAVGLGLTFGAGEAAAQSAEGPEEERTNVVVVMTDDQDAASLGVMEKTRRELGRAGTRFENFLATFPLCCPSRATFLTGQYAHNHGVLSNVQPDGGYAAFDDSETLPVWLNRAGYRTGFIGKYLNGYDAEPVSTIPPGWDEWYVPVDQTTGQMYGYTLNENGQRVKYGQRPTDYQTDVFAGKAVDFIRRHAGRGPFFLTVSTLAPHGERGRRRLLPNPRPAPRHTDRFENRPLARPPSFNEADLSDKPAILQAKGRIVGNELNRLRRVYQSRLATLLAVDDAVGRIVERLRRSGELNNTLIIFTSDNGFLLGEHRLTKKHVLYEESIQVPMVMRGPGVPEGLRRERPAGNIDLAPTILDATGAEAGPEPLDGVSLLSRAARTQRDLLLENNKGSVGIRTPSYAYFEHETGESELYDLVEDPFELHSIHVGSPHEEPGSAALQASLAGRLDALEDCQGNSCR